MLSIYFLLMQLVGGGGTSAPGPSGSTVGAILGVYPGGVTVGLSTTTFIAPYRTAFHATESNSFFPMPVGGTAAKLYVRTSTAQPATGDLVFTVRVNSVDTSMIVTVPASAAAGVFSDTVDTAAISEGDTLSIRAANAATGASAGVMYITLVVQ